MTGELVAFQRRRTYLDACRDRGVFQRDEELRAENAELTSQLANRQKQTSADVTGIASVSVTASAFSDALAACRREMADRTGAMLDAFIAAGMDRECLPLLKHILINTDTDAAQAEGLFRAVRSKRKEHE